MPRLFVALPIPPVIEDRLLDAMEGLPGARWQDAENLHITLRFVGEVDGAVAQDLMLALSQVRAETFQLRLRGVGHFGKSGKKPHTLWAGLEPCEKLEALRQKVEHACAAVGLPREERRFTPHVTLARLNSSVPDIGHWLARNALLSCHAWPVDDFALYESHLTAHGSQYEERVRYPLGLRR